MRSYRNRLVFACRNAFQALAIAATSLTVSACGPPIANDFRSPYSPPGNQAPALTQHEYEVLEDIKVRNMSVEDDPAWIQDALARLHIRSLLEIPPEEDTQLAGMLDAGRLYIMVHPAYWAFFDQDEPSDEEIRSAGNGLDRKLAEEHSAATTALIKAQEKLQRDFLEYMSTEQKLVLLVIPPDDGFPNSTADYTRFINEVTNGSPSVLYVYSKEPSQGAVDAQTLKRIQAFIKGVQPQIVILGGGYAGRCVHGFQKSARKALKGEVLVTAAELTSFSPYDMTMGTALSILNDDGSLDVDELTRALAEHLGKRAKVKSFSRGEISPQAAAGAQ